MECLSKLDAEEKKYFLDYIDEDVMSFKLKGYDLPTLINIQSLRNQQSIIQSITDLSDQIEKVIRIIA